MSIAEKLLENNFNNPYYFIATTMKADKIGDTLIAKGYKLVHTDGPNKISGKPSELRIMGNSPYSKYQKGLGTSVDTIEIYYGGADSYEVSGNNRRTIDGLERL